MARIDWDAIEIFVSITGATEAVALQKLEAYGGDLNEAVNAYYNDKDFNTTSHHNSRDNIINMENPMDVDAEGSTFSSRTMQRRIDPFSIFDSFLPGALHGVRSSFLSGSAPQVSHPREVREIPIDFKDDRGQLGHSTPIIEDITGIASEHGPEVQGTVVFDDKDDEDAVIPSPKGEKTHYEFDVTKPGTSVSTSHDFSDSSDDIDEQMIKAAIEASKLEAERLYEFDVTKPGTSVSTSHDFSDSRDDIDEQMIKAAIEASKLEAERHVDHHISDSYELERVLIAKQASLPPEAAIDDANTITILIRLPGGSCCERRFLKFEKLRSLFDFIDVGRVVAPGTYRLVRPFPKRAFGEAESDISLNELGLTSKQELLFLELI